MIDIRPFESLGHAEFGWLKAKHHFSFGRYHDHTRMALGTLKVWNDDTIAPGTGFDRHGHRDMEIITYVRRGAITHRDHLGNEGRTLAGDIQVMSAGNGILHEEYNLEDEITQIFQIWIEPAEAGGTPSWQTTSFPRDARAGQLVTLASGRTDKPEDALPIRQDAALLGATLKPGDSIELVVEAARHAYLVPASGDVLVNDRAISERTGVAISGPETVTVVNATDATGDAELIVADVPDASDTSL